MRDWLEAAGLFVLFAALGGLIALPAGLITIPAHIDWAGLLPVALIAFFVPAIGEELVFRVWMGGRAACFEAASQHLSMRNVSVSQPPHPEMPASAGLEGWKSLVRPTIALGLFILWHPVQIWLGLPMAQDVFLDPAFLGIAGLLGIACTISWQRSGSIWPPVILHWLTVVGWKALAG